MCTPDVKLHDKKPTISLFAWRTSSGEISSQVLYLTNRSEWQKNDFEDAVLALANIF